MKTLLSTVLLAALVVVCKAPGQTPTSVTAQPSARHLSSGDLRRMLEHLGHDPRPIPADDGTVTRFSIRLTRNSDWVRCSIAVADRDGVHWVRAGLLAFTEREPPTLSLLLECLAAHHKLWPAHLVLYRNGWLELAMPITERSLTAEALEIELQRFMDEFLVIKEVIINASRNE